MSRTAIPVASPDRGSFVPAGRPNRDSVVLAGRPESSDFNYGLVACFAACVAFWTLVALTVYWLI